MATRVDYQCNQCKCVAYVRPPKCWYCGSEDIHEVLVYAKNQPLELLKQMDEAAARVKLAVWNAKVRGSSDG